MKKIFFYVLITCSAQSVFALTIQECSRLLTSMLPFAGSEKVLMEAVLTRPNFSHIIENISALSVNKNNTHSYAEFKIELGVERLLVQARFDSEGVLRAITLKHLNEDFSVKSKKLGRVAFAELIARESYIQKLELKVYSQTSLRPFADLARDQCKGTKAHCSSELSRVSMEAAKISDQILKTYPELNHKIANEAGAKYFYHFENINPLDLIQITLKPVANHRTKSASSIEFLFKELRLEIFTESGNIQALKMEPLDRRVKLPPLSQNEDEMMEALRIFVRNAQNTSIKVFVREFGPDEMLPLGLPRLNLDPNQVLLEVSRGL